MITNPYFNTIKDRNSSGFSGLNLGTQLAATGTSMIPASNLDNPYELDATKPLKFAAQGASMGATIGGAPGVLIGGIAGAAAGTIAAPLEQRNALRNTNMNINAFTDTGYGTPAYQGGAVNQGLTDLSNLNKVSNNPDASWLMPMALPTKVAGLFNRRKLRRTKEALSGTIEGAQQDYNQAVQDYEQNQIAQTQYRRRRDLTNRMYNLYSI